MIGTFRTIASRSCSGLPCAAILVVFIAGCSTVPPVHVEPPPIVIEAPPPASDFTIAADMLDTWNAVGQILVRTDGATYEGRAQMLGLYDVLYRGERFLVLTRALALTGKDQGAATRVSVVLPDGKPDANAAAIELLGVLQARLPEEIRLDASGVRGKKKVGRDKRGG
jgi:hypothetical protein